MPYRPLNGEEKKVTLENIKDMQTQILSFQEYLNRLNNKLKVGVWYEDEEESRQAWAKATKIAAEDRRRSDEQETALYGRLLTHAEHLGWVDMPQQL